MDRRRFDHFFEELCIALGEVVPRYALWIFMSECDAHPEGLSRAVLVTFCREHLDTFLADHDLLFEGDDLRLSAAKRRRLTRALERFDPTRPTPYEHMARIGGSFEGH